MVEKINWTDVQNYVERTEVISIVPYLNIVL
jgi:hypothetical protein